MSFTFAGAEVDSPTRATYSYSVTSSGSGGTVTGSGNITAANQQVTGVDVSGLGDGTLSLSVTLSDPAGNTGTAATATVTKDIVAPSGYAASIDQGVINSLNKTAMSFHFASAELGATYNFTVSSSGGSTAVTGSGAIGAANQQVTGINVSGLDDGTLTLSVTLSDPAGNTGAAATATKTKDATPPSGYTVGIEQTVVNLANEAAMSFHFASAELGATYSFTVSSSGGSTTVTGSGTIGTANQQVTGISVSGLGDGTLTLSATLTDTAGNAGTAANDTVAMDTLAPTISSLAIANTGSTEATIVFSENVFGNSGGTLTLNSNSIAITDTTSPGSIATPTFVSYNSGTFTAVYSISWSTPPTPTTDTIQVSAETASSIFDAAGNPMATSSIAGDAAKVLAFFGLHLKPAAIGATSPSTTAVGRW